MSIDFGAARRAFQTYAGAPIGAQAFVLARYVVAPMGPLAGEFAGMEGSVVSLGSGLSMLERYLVELEPGLSFEGIDCDPVKVDTIERTRHRSPRVSLIEGDATAPLKPESYDGALVCDAMHHFPATTHAEVLASVVGAVRRGGLIVIKDLDVAPRWKYHWNRVHDRLVAGPEPIHCRAPEEMADLLRDAGAEITKVERIDHRATPYAHYLLRARKP